MATKKSSAFSRLAAAAVAASLAAVSAAADDAPSVTLGTPALRRAAEHLPGPVATPFDWLSALPDIRLRMGISSIPDFRHPGTSFDSFDVRAVEFRLPATSSLWLGVEEDPESLRATLSLQRSF